MQKVYNLQQTVNHTKTRITFGLLIIITFGHSLKKGEFYNTINYIPCQFHSLTFVDVLFMQKPSCETTTKSLPKNYNHKNNQKQQPSKKTYLKKNNQFSFINA